MPKAKSNKSPSLRGLNTFEIDKLDLMLYKAKVIHRKRVDRQKYKEVGYIISCPHNRDSLVDIYLNKNCDKPLWGYMTACIHQEDGTDRWEYSLSADNCYAIIKREYQRYLRKKYEESVGK